MRDLEPGISPGWSSGGGELGPWGDRVAATGEGASRSEVAALRFADLPARSAEEYLRRILGNDVRSRLILNEF